MITLKEYEVEDWVSIDDAVEPFSPMMPPDGFLEMTRKNGVAVTAIEDEKTMACGGVVYVGKGESVVWVKVSKKCLEQPFKWARTILETFRIIKETLHPMTVTSYIMEEFCKGERVARMIGMKKTGVPYDLNGKKYNKYAVVI